MYAFLVGFPILVYLAWWYGGRERASPKTKMRETRMTVEMQTVKLAQAVLEYVRESGGRNIHYDPHNLIQAEMDPFTVVIRVEGNSLHILGSNEPFDAGLREHLEKRRKETEADRHPAESMSEEEKAALPVLNERESCEILSTTCKLGRVRATVDGILGADATGEWFLTPEKDYQGPGYRAIRARISPTAEFPGHGEVFRVSGIFDPDKGLWVEKIEHPI
jgi:hypothetical protein